MFNWSKFNIDDWEILNFYSYTSYIMDNSDSNAYTLYDGFKEINSKKKHPNVENFLRHTLFLLSEKARQISKNNGGFTGNKTVFRIHKKDSYEYMFIGMYDDVYTIGERCYVREGCIYDFKKNKWSGTVRDVVCHLNGIMFKKFDF